MADEPDAEAMAEQLANFDVEQFLVAAASSLASLAFAKLEKGDLAQSKKAIDALASLLPHVTGELRSDLEQALVNLQVAYATTVSG
ncbi:MAG: hypothetical protein H0X39_15850 [Actinobacteria bacterium]|nr:hypothetical protein [Actinomycetota bacterium]